MIVDFMAITDSFWQNETQTGRALIILLNEDLISVNLESKSAAVKDAARYDCTPNPYELEMTSDSTQITCVKIINDSDSILLGCLNQIKSRIDRKNSEKSESSESGVKSRKLHKYENWPLPENDDANDLYYDVEIEEPIVLNKNCKTVNGRQDLGITEIIITGHSDGTVKFWDACDFGIEMLCKVRTQKIFEKSAGSLEIKFIYRVVFFKISYFGVKHGHLRPFWVKKRDFRTFLDQKMILINFGSKRVNFGQFLAIFSHF